MPTYDPSLIAGMIGRPPSSNLGQTVLDTWLAIQALKNQQAQVEEDRKRRDREDAMRERALKLQIETARRELDKDKESDKREADARKLIGEWTTPPKEYPGSAAPGAIPMTTGEHQRGVMPTTATPQVLGALATLGQTPETYNVPGFATQQREREKQALFGQQRELASLTHPPKSPATTAAPQTTYASEWLDRGLQAFGSGDTANARRAFQTAKQLDPTLATVVDGYLTEADRPDPEAGPKAELIRRLMDNVGISQEDATAAWGLWGEEAPDKMASLQRLAFSRSDQSRLEQSAETSALLARINAKLKIYQTRLRLETLPVETKTKLADWINRWQVLTAAAQRGETKISVDSQGRSRATVSSPTGPLPPPPLAPTGVNVQPLSQALAELDAEIDTGFNPPPAQLRLQVQMNPGAYGLPDAAVSQITAEITRLAQQKRANPADPVSRKSEADFQQWLAKWIDAVLQNEAAKNANR